MHALITGASGAIGTALSQALAARQVSLSLVARRTGPMQDLAAQVPVDTCVISADLAELDVATAAFESATRSLGPVDILINNAGIQYVEPGAGVSPDRIAKMMAVNVTIPLALTHLAVAGMVARGHGTVIQISSMAGLTATPWMAHYSGAKAALAVTTEAMRVELQGTGVHLLTVYPGPVASPMESAANAAFDHTAASATLPRGTPEGLATAILAAMDRRAPRVIYPRAYGVSRYLRATSQWLVDHFTPRPHA